MKGKQDYPYVPVHVAVKGRQVDVVAEVEGDEVVGDGVVKVEVLLGAPDREPRPVDGVVVRVDLVQDDLDPVPQVGDGRAADGAVFAVGDVEGLAPAVGLSADADLFQAIAD